MSKAKAMGNARKVIKKVDHGGKVFTWIPSGMAAAGPPLGSQLGQIGVNIANFVKDFNLKTSINKVTSDDRPHVPRPLFNFLLFVTFSRRACPSPAT